jgi:hypothetical protein
MTASPCTTRYYARVPTQFLGRLLSRAAGGSAIHKAIRDEIRRREVNKAPDTEMCLLFTTEEWSKTSSVLPVSLGSEPASPITASRYHSTA